MTSKQRPTVNNGDYFWVPGVVVIHRFDWSLAFLNLFTSGLKIWLHTLEVLRNNQRHPYGERVQQSCDDITQIKLNKV